MAGDLAEELLNGCGRFLDIERAWVAHEQVRHVGLALGASGHVRRVRRNAIAVPLWFLLWVPPPPGNSNNDGHVPISLTKSAGRGGGGRRRLRDRLVYATCSSAPSSPRGARIRAARWSVAARSADPPTSNTPRRKRKRYTSAGHVASTADCEAAGGEGK